jgi:hypothetical protein
MSSPDPRRRMPWPGGPSGWMGEGQAATGPAQPSAIDQTVERLQHRWETDERYRTRVSAGCGVAGLVFLCVLAAVVSTVANASMGGPPSSPRGGVFAGAGSGGAIQGNARFPTATVPDWTPGKIPNAGPVPESQTPVPGPTPTVTATPLSQYGTPTGTGTPGSLPTTCNGNSGSATWAFNPCPLVAGQGGTFSARVPGNANSPVNILISFGNCANGANCTLPFLPNQNHLDGNSSITVSFTVPAAAANNTAPVSGMLQVQGGPSFRFAAAPVQ